MKNLNYLTDHILYQIFKIILSISKRNMQKRLIKININKIENRNIFKIKTGYYLKLLTPKTMKLLGSTKNKITNDENGENMPHLEITEVVLVHCNFVNNDYQQDSRVLHTYS